MFVIKHGRAFMQKECNKCHCVFAFIFDDIGEEWEQQGDTDDDWVGTAYVCCPECNNKITWPIRTSEEITEWRASH